jgi:TonB-linked SusC/RagA family outer membrane protein
MLCIAAATPARAQQPARANISGTVKDASSGAPVAGVAVRVFGTPYAASTNEQGRYTIANVPNGIYAIEARRIGFGLARKENIKVNGAPVTLDIDINSAPLSLEAVSVSATVDPTSGVKAPFAVAKLNSEDMPVPTAAAASTALIGKISGVNVLPASGAPGSGAYVQIRTPSSPFKSNSPLYIVDGVPLNENQSVTTQDIEGMDIASIEVIKGAAAAALYGSRAAGGVISITTNRGNNLALGKTQITLRNDFGIDQWYNQPKKRTHHWYKVNDQGQWLDAQGNVVGRANRIVDPDGFIDNPYPVVYDNIGQITRTPRTMNSTVSIAQNSATGNYMMSFTRNRQPGTVIESFGYLRQNVRFNIDQSIRDNLTVGLRADYSRATENPSQINFQNLYAIDPDVNLLALNDDGSPYRAKPDSASTISNPLYLQRYRDNHTRRARGIYNGTASWRATNWLSFNGNASYDRGDRVVDNYTPPGLPSTDGESITTGSISFAEDEVDGLTLSLAGTAMKDFRDLTTRLTIQAEQQRERNLFFTQSGSNFSVAGVRDINGAGTKTVSSSLTDTRLNAAFASLGLDYAGKYIGDFLVRREASSLFGPAHRTNYFYRAAGGYLMSNESWWPWRSITTFKPRYSYGTAGTRPDFADQYAVVNITTGGLIRDALGNPELRPEMKYEHEMGVDMIVKNRLQFIFTYARSTTKDAIVAITAPSITGYNTYNANVGKTRGETFEGTIEGQWVNRKNFRWNTNFVVDRSQSTVLEYKRSCYTDGIRYRCDNVPLTSMWGASLLHDKADLRREHKNSLDQFEVNDEGYLVPVGAGNHYTDGVAKKLWGTTVRIDGIAYRWGEPMYKVDSLGIKSYDQIGNSQPLFNFGLGNRLNYKGLQVYFLVNGQVGGDIYNNVRQTNLNSLDSPEVEQGANKATELKKPYYYYSVGVTKNNADYLREFVEKGTYAKLSEVDLSYSLSPTRFGLIRKLGADRLNLELIGRNLFTATHYRGNDPQTAGSQNSRVDAGVYPLARNFTGSVTVVF